MTKRLAAANDLADKAGRELEISRQQVAFWESQSLLASTRADKAERERDELRETNANNVAGYQQQVADLTAACGGPLRVCLCGSTRYADAFFAAGWAMTLRGQIVLSIGVCKHAAEHGAEALGELAVANLDELHKRKIDLADWVLVLNIGGYYGKSTKGEIEYAKKTGKPVVFLYPDVPLPLLPPDVNCWEDFDVIAKAVCEAWDYANHQSFIKRNPGQPLLDELARLRRLEAALGDDGLIDKVVSDNFVSSGSEHRGGLYISAYRAALKAAMEKEPAPDGLCLPGECGCSADDPRPCGDDETKCVPGYRGNDGLYYPTPDAAKNGENDGK
jgi:hypothetical protein